MRTRDDTLLKILNIVRSAGVAAVLSGPCVAAQAATVALCPHVSLEVDEPVRLGDTERELICGDPDNPPWSEIPVRQAAYFLKNFLQDRGYHRTSHEIQGEKLVFRAGPLTLVREVALQEPPTEIDPTRFWKLYGRALTPESLDELGKWLETELSNEGFPCVPLDLAANPETGVITVTFGEAHKVQMPRVVADYIKGVNGEVQKRYYAFAEGDEYDALKLDLSARRMVEDEIVLAANFVTTCAPDRKSVKVEQRLVAGEPRLVSAGVGLDTEEYLIAEAGWKHTRLGQQASRLAVSARASFVRQTLRGTFDWYYAPVVARHFLRETLTVERQNERRYESRTAKLEAGPAWTRDTGDYYMELWTGVAYEQAATIRGVGPAMTRQLTTEGNVHIRSHGFEYYASAPRSGFTLSLDGQRAAEGVGSDITASRGALSGTGLWNVFDLDPPIWILGLRGDLVTTVPGNGTEPEELPASMRNYLGGSENMRGFTRKSLPPSDLGALTTAYLGAEARMSEVLPFKLQPIVFVDFGKIGMHGVDLDQEVFWSPGTGLNWQSPFGTLRGTIAHGFIEGPRREVWQHLARWQLFISFGEQF